jgi:hypothetical protein
MSQKYYLVKVGPANPGEYMTVPGDFRAIKHGEKLTRVRYGSSLEQGLHK